VGQQAILYLHRENFVAALEQRVCELPGARPDFKDDTARWNTHGTGDVGEDAAVAQEVLTKCFAGART
jgi:hypothetical protein